MNQFGDNNLLQAARGALLDALEALHQHLQAVVVIGAQAVYLHTGSAQLALAEATKDSDLALDTRSLADYPLIEEAMREGGFHLNPQARQPGAWVNDHGIPVDLMVPESLAGGPGRRGARIPPHSKNAARRAVGLEATVVDHAPMQIQALLESDRRSYTANVAGPAALLVAKLHKLGERQKTPGRFMDKDAHDIYGSRFQTLSTPPRPVSRGNNDAGTSLHGRAVRSRVGRAWRDNGWSSRAGNRCTTNSLDIGFYPRQRPVDHHGEDATMTIHPVFFLVD